MFPINISSITKLTEGKKIVKESRFSYIRPVDGVTKLKLYTCSNITGLENIVHRGNQDIVEILNGYLILFTEDAFHTAVSKFERGNGSYPSNLRNFSYIVENEYITGDENIISLNQKNNYNANYQTC